MERHREADGLAARLLGQERDLRPIGQHEALGARIEIRGARVERLAGDGGGVALVIPDHRGEVDGRRNRRARGLRVGNELADGDVRPLQVLLRDAVDAGGGDGAIAVARDEEQTPVAQRDRFRDRDRESLRVRHRLVEIDCRLAADARDLRFGHGLLREALDRREHRVACRRERIGVGDLREERERPRLAQLAHPRLDGGRLLRRHQRLVEASGGRDGQHVAQHVERDKVRMRAAHRVVHHAEKFRPAGAAQRHRPLAVLHGLLGVDRRQRARGLRDRPEILDDETKRRVGIELAGDDQHRVVGLVVEPVERLQPADVDVLDVRARADLQVPVVVPHERRGEHPSVQHELRVVLAALELVAHHRHLRIEVALADVRVDHPVGFHPERPGEIVVAGGERLEIVGAIEAGRAVVLHAALAELGLDVAAAWRALEHEVLQQMRHAGLAVVLVGGADLVGDVDGRRRLRRVREEQDLEAVREPVFGDAFDRGPLRYAGGQRGGCGEREQAEQEGGEMARMAEGSHGQDRRGR